MDESTYIKRICQRCGEPLTDANNISTIWRDVYCDRCSAVMVRLGLTRECPHATQTGDECDVCGAYVNSLGRMRRAEC